MFGQSLFDPDWPQPMNVGGLGVFLGHEMGHSLDRDFIEFDEQGYYAPIDNERFNRDYDQFVECLSEKYSKVCPLHYSNGTVQCVNGSLTVEENISDMIGMELAYRLHKFLGANMSSTHPAFA